jgi:hypothetical protein
MYSGDEVYDDEVTSGPSIDFAESQRFYNAGYAAGRRALAEELYALLESMGDRGDNEFGWKAPIRDLAKAPK